MLDSQFDVKIVDFGFSTPLNGRDRSGLLKSYVGTPEYMAPEMLTKNPSYLGCDVDLFAAVAILFIMYS